jgi:hypothetical protein
MTGSSAICADSVAAGEPGWLMTTHRHPVKSRKVIATYLAPMAFQLIHMSEGYTRGFPHEIVQLLHSPATGGIDRSC